MDKILRWWLHVDFKTRLISIVILVISITMSSIMFSVLASIQSELVDADTRFYYDFSIVVANSIACLIQNTKPEDLKDFIEKLYLTTSSIHHIRFFNIYGDLIFSFPMHASLLQQDLGMLDYADILTTNLGDLLFSAPLVSRSINLDYCIVSLIAPVLYGSNNLGFLQIGFSSNSTLFYSTYAVQNFSVAIFVMAWLMFIIGVAFNFFIIVRPMDQLLIGLRNISLGSFNYYIDSSFNGKIGNLINGFNEVSRRLLRYEKKNVVQLVSEKAKMEALVSIISDGAVLLDTELRLLFANHVAIKMFQWSNKDLIGKTIFQFLPMHVNEALLPVLNSMMKSSCLHDKVVHVQELHVDLYYGSLKTFRFFLSTVLSQEGCRLNSLVITIQDVTREAQLNEAKSRFISNVSHELRTPLCNIRSFLETLIDYNYRLTEQQKSQFLSISYAETQRLNSLVDDVLDLSRLESEYSYDLNPVMLSVMVRYIIQASQIIIVNKKVQVLVEIHHRIKNILAHESSLCQVLSNLISNALKFTHRRGRIVVRIYPLEASTESSSSLLRKLDVSRIEIIDEGIGIDKVYQRQIFDRFMRIENHIHAIEGTGLGLAIVRSIVEKHGSIISVYSQSGIGTSFWFDLLIAH